MKLFEIETIKTDSVSAYDTIRNGIMQAKKEKQLIQSGSFYRVKTDFLSNLVLGEIFWSNDVNKSLAQYKQSSSHEFFRGTDEIIITPSNLSDLLIGTTPGTKLMYPLDEEQGYDFAQNLLHQYSLQSWLPHLQKNRLCPIFFFLTALFLLLKIPANIFRGYRINGNGKKRETGLPNCSFLQAKDKEKIKKSHSLLLAKEHLKFIF